MFFNLSTTQHSVIFIDNRVHQFVTSLLSTCLTPPTVFFEISAIGKQHKGAEQIQANHFANHLHSEIKTVITILFFCT